MGEYQPGSRRPIAGMFRRTAGWGGGYLGLRLGGGRRAGESVPGVLGGDQGGDDGLRGDAGAGGDGTAAVRGGDVEAVSDDGAGGGGVDHHWVEGAVWGAVG